MRQPSNELPRIQGDEVGEFTGHGPPEEPTRGRRDRSRGSVCCELGGGIPRVEGRVPGGSYYLSRQGFRPMLTVCLEASERIYLNDVIGFEVLEISAEGATFAISQTREAPIRDVETQGGESGHRYLHV